MLSDFVCVCLHRNNLPVFISKWFVNAFALSGSGPINFIKQRKLFQLKCRANNSLDN
jgi:hypothetical protein